MEVSLAILGLCAFLFFGNSETKAHINERQLMESKAKTAQPALTPKEFDGVSSSISMGDVPSLNVENLAIDSEKEYRTLLKFITSRYRHVSQRDAELISSYLVSYGKKHNIDPKFAAAVIARESSFNRKAVSKTGAKGLGQIKDFNHKALKIQDPFDIKQNVNGTISYLKKMIGRWRSNSKKVNLALASYYKGPNAIRRLNGQLDDETTRYVNDILAYYQEIKSLRNRF